LPRRTEKDVKRLEQPASHAIESVLRNALAEDLGAAGDITSAAIIDQNTMIEASIVARGDGVVAGLSLSLRAFAMVDATITTVAVETDGSIVGSGAALATVAGPALGVLGAERTCLNMLGHLSGIATATRQVVDSVAHTGASVVDTRKTTPGLRALEKYAVRAGGGRNHRFGLFDAVLIKDNHLDAAGGIAQAVAAARAASGHTVKVEVEVEDLPGLDAAIEAGADAVLLDNMTVDEMAEAVTRTRGRLILEASGGITPTTAVAAAESGVDVISLGWLTHSAPNWDVAMDIDRTYRSPEH